MNANGMQHLGPAFRASALLLGLAVAGCGSTGFDWAGSSPAPEPAQPAAPRAAPVNLAGRWLLSSPGRGQCPMTFGSAAATAAEGTIAPEGGCPGKFFTSRKWTYDQAGLTIRDHKGQPLALLSGEGASYQGKATTGETIALSR
jgi:hypothetical protein